MTWKIGLPYVLVTGLMLGGVGVLADAGRPGWALLLLILWIVVGLLFAAIAMEYETQKAYTRWENERNPGKKTSLRHR